MVRRSPLLEGAPTLPAIFKSIRPIQSVVLISHNLQMARRLMCNQHGRRCLWPLQYSIPSTTRSSSFVNNIETSSTASLMQPVLPSGLMRSFPVAATYSALKSNASTTRPRSFSQLSFSRRDTSSIASTKLHMEIWPARPCRSDATSFCLTHRG